MDRKKQLEQQSKEQMQEQLTALKVALAEKQEHVRNEEQHVRRLVEEWEETKRTRAKWKRSGINSFII